MKKTDDVATCQKPRKSPDFHSGSGSNMKRTIVEIHSSDSETDDDSQKPVPLYQNARKLRKLEAFERALCPWRPPPFFETANNWIRQFSNDEVATIKDLAWLETQHPEESYHPNLHLDKRYFNAENRTKCVQNPIWDQILYFALRLMSGDGHLIPNSTTFCGITVSHEKPFFPQFGVLIHLISPFYLNKWMTECASDLFTGTRFTAMFRRYSFRPEVYESPFK